jgi:hypothetical protein
VNEPCYWKNDISGILRPAVEHYFSGVELSASDIVALQAYLRQWIYADVWRAQERIDGLRDMVESLTSRAQIELWCKRADELGVDPW